MLIEKKILRQKSRVAPLYKQMDESFSQEANQDESWRSWLGEHAPRLLLFARQQTRIEADAEDVLQEALVESWKRAGDQIPPLPLVFATIRRRAIDQARRADRREKREMAANPDDVVWFDASGTETEGQEELEAGMKKLPQIYREVVTLKVWGELTFQQIAEVLEIPLNTVASRYRYGLEGLRKNLKRMNV